MIPVPPRRIRWLVAVALLAVASASCGSSHGDTAAASGGGGGGTTSLSVPAGSVSAAQGAFQYAIARGYFAKYGLKVSTPRSAEGQLKQAIVAGSVPFDQLAGGDVLSLFANHSPIRTVACTARNTGYYLFARKGTRTVADLAGKKVGVPSLGGAPQVAMESYLVAKGLSPDAVTFVPLGSIPNVLAALTGGRIDSGLLSTPFNVKAEQAGLPGLGYATGPPTPYIVNTRWAKSHPAQVTGLLEGFIEGTWAYQTRESDGLPVLAKWLGLDPAKDQATLKRSFAAYLPPVQQPPGRCRAADFQPYIRFLPASQRAALADLTPLIDNSYVDQLAGRHFYDRMKTTYGPLPKGTSLTQVIG
jgi:ABC-type nitrate/sulfonate/bicarbonate transport system substrate-binding protein